MPTRLGLFLATLLVVSAAESQAQALWYNGDPVAGSAVLTQRSSVWTAIAYDNFVVNDPNWMVNGLFGNFMVFDNPVPHPLPTTAFWEIRTGISTGDGGSLLYSGENSFSWTPNGFNMGGIGHYGEVSGFTPFALGPGTYWLGIAPLWDFHNLDDAIWIYFANLANGPNALHDKKYFFNSPSDAFGGPYDFVENNGLATDLSYGVLGTIDSVPEPETVLLLGTGLVAIGLLASRLRRRPWPRGPGIS